MKVIDYKVKPVSGDYVERDITFEVDGKEHQFSTRVAFADGYYLRYYLNDDEITDYYDLSDFASAPDEKELAVDLETLNEVLYYNE